MKMKTQEGGEGIMLSWWEAKIAPWMMMTIVDLIMMTIIVIMMQWIINTFYMSVDDNDNEKEDRLC